MKSYPLTFAVFFQSILAPNMSVPKNNAKDILFAEQYPLPENSVAGLSSGTFSDYIKGKRPIRAESVRLISKMPPEALISRMKLLGLQDMHAALQSTKNLLEICEISTSLRQELQTEADTEPIPALYLAKIFQLSLKCDNKKRLLTSEDTAFLHKIDTMAFPWQEEPKQAAADISGDSDTISLADLETYGSDSLPFLIPKEKQLFEKYGIFLLKEKFFKGFHISLQDVILPEDFDAFWTFIRPAFSENSVLELSVENVIETCALDMEEKICKKGKLQLLEASCINGDLSRLQTSLLNLDFTNCKNCIVVLFGDISLMEADEIAVLFQDLLTDSAAIIFGIVCARMIPHHHWLIRAVFRIEPPAPKKPVIPEFLSRNVSARARKPVDKRDRSL